MFSSLLHLISLALLARAGSSSQHHPASNDVQSVLKSAGVIPSILPEFKAQISFGIIYNDHSVRPAENLTVNGTQSEPKFLIDVEEAKEKNYAYTIAIVDPDAPYPEQPTYAQIAHFLQTDLTVSKKDCRDISSIHGGKDRNGPVGETWATLTNQSAPLIPYAGPAPPADSNPHRYVVALYRQVSGLHSIKAPEGFPTNFTDVNNRALFNLTGFADQVQGDLELVGATVFYVGPDATSSSSTRRHVRDFQVGF